jgi:hypothetical protein
MADQPREILLKFIADESSALAREEQGSFFPNNHHRISPLIVRAPKLLQESDRNSFYFYLLRLNECPSVKSESEFQLLQQSYGRLLPLLDRGYPICSLPRTKGLFLFGRNDLGSVIPESEVTFAFYKRNLDFWRYANSFWHTRGMLKKQQKFIELAEDANLLSHTQKILSQMQLSYDLTLTTDIWFWSLVLLVLQNEEASTSLVNKILSEDLPAKELNSIYRILIRYLTASDRKNLAMIVEAQLQSLS